MKLLRRLCVLSLVLGLAACTTVIARAPVPEGQIEAARPYGIDTTIVRGWGDTLRSDGSSLVLTSYVGRIREAHQDLIDAGRPIPEVTLALSGGGPDGAYGAGYLRGWTERGDRPQFDLVTGISTGAIIALFAFLGPEYDPALEEIYTTYETDQLIVRTIFAGLTGGSALADTRRYRGLIEEYIDDDVVAELAEAHRHGRTLLIGTTNIDASRPVVWNITGIAATGHPDAARLIHDIVQASSAIPAAFPPVLIPVETPDGGRYDEMHVDGGATQQVMLFSPSFPTRLIDEALGAQIDRTIYVIINNKLRKPYQPVRPRLLSIASKAASSLIGGSGTGDIYRIFAIAQRDGIDLHVRAIPTDFDSEPEEAFDRVYMKALYDLGRDEARSGEGWIDHPPDYAPWPVPLTAGPAP